MKGLRFYPARGFVWLMIACAIMATGCGGGKKEKAKENSEQSGVMPVRTWKAALGSMQRLMRVTGDIRAGEEVKIAPLSPGRIKRIPVKEGQRVVKGAVLVQMDDNSLIAAEENYLSAKADYDRAQELQKTGNIAPSQYEKLKLAYRAAESQYTMLKDNTRIRAPFSGWIGSIFLREGEVYSGMSQTPAGGPAIMVLHDLSSVRVLCRVAETDLPLVREGMPVQFYPTAFEGKQFRGRVKSVNRSAEGASRSYGVEITAANSGQQLKAGMFARCEIIIEERVDCMAVPSDAVLDSNKIFVAAGDTAYSRQVEVGLVTPEKTEVIKGLETGEELIVEGNYGLKDRSRIQRIDEK